MNLPDPGVEPGSLALQGGSLSAELSGKPIYFNTYIYGFQLKFTRHIKRQEKTQFKDTKLLSKPESDMTQWYDTSLMK